MGLLGVDAPVPGIDPVGLIRREYLHLDLYVDSGMPGSKLALENKLHSIPMASQLSRYHAGFEGQRGADVTAFVLLSLMQPAFDLPHPWQWRGL